MGVIYSLNCPDCGYGRWYFSGDGFKDFKEPQIKIEIKDIFDDIRTKRKYKKRSLEERIQNGDFGREIKDIVNSQNIDDLRFFESPRRNYPFYCSKCEKISIRSTKSVGWYDKEIGSYINYNVPQYCLKCKSELISPEEGIIKAKCPKCNSLNALISPAGLWD